MNRKRDSVAKESSLEKHLDESVQDDTLMKRNIIERRSSKNIGNLNTRFDTNSFHSLKKEGELKLNLNLCPILIDQEVENLTYSKTARNEYNHKYSTGSHENQENKTTASAEFVKKKKKRSQKNRMMTAREYIVKQGRNYNNLLLYNIDDLDNMIKSLSQIGSQETSNSESTNSPKTQNKI